MNDELQSFFDTEACQGCDRLPRSLDHVAQDMGWEYSMDELTDELCKYCAQCPDCCTGHNEEEDDDWFE